MNTSKKSSFRLSFGQALLIVGLLVLTAAVVCAAVFDSHGTNGAAPPVPAAISSTLAG